MRAAWRATASCDRPARPGLLFLFLFLFVPAKKHPDRTRIAPARVSAPQDFCSHFSKMASHCCLAHFTESSGLITPVAALAIMSVMMKLL